MNKRSEIENDVQLIHMIKAGDKSAFGKLYYLHQNRVRRHCRAICAGPRGNRRSDAGGIHESLSEPAPFSRRIGIHNLSDAHCHQRRAVTPSIPAIPKKWHGNSSATHARTNYSDNARR